MLINPIHLKKLETPKLHFEKQLEKKVQFMDKKINL